MNNEINNYKPDNYLKYHSSVRMRFSINAIFVISIIICINIK